jgi:hypothetical protein
MADSLRARMLAVRLAAARQALAESLSVLEHERETGSLTAAQAAEQARRVRASYDRECAAAERER